MGGGWLACDEKGRVWRRVIWGEGDGRGREGRGLCDNGFVLVSRAIVYDSVLLE